MKLVRSDTQRFNFLDNLLLHLLQLGLHVGYVRGRVGNSLRRWYRERPSKSKPEANLPGIRGVDVVGLGYWCIALMDLLVKIVEEVTPARAETNPKGSK